MDGKDGLLIVRLQTTLWKSLMKLNNGIVRSWLSMERKPVNVRVIAKRIEKIASKPKVDLVVVWCFGSDDEPQGKGIVNFRNV